MTAQTVAHGGGGPHLTAGGHVPAGKKGQPGAQDGQSRQPCGVGGDHQKVKVCAGGVGGEVRRVVSPHKAVFFSQTLSQTVRQSV